MAIWLCGDVAKLQSSKVSKLQDFKDSKFPNSKNENLEIPKLPKQTYLRGFNGVVLSNLDWCLAPALNP